MKINLPIKLDNNETHQNFQAHEMILGVKVNPTSYQETVQSVIVWAEASQSRSVCATSVHGLMIAYDNPAFRTVLNAADLITPDGMPLVWTLRLNGHKNQTRVYGPTLMEKILPKAAEKEIPVGLLGSTPRVIEKLQKKFLHKYPHIKIAYALSPPFRAFSIEENENMVQEIIRSGARILFVGLGCPKQELWMHVNKGKINAVMVGVGAAFDFIAGEKQQAPDWMQNKGLEWFYRLLKEPKRLWSRYFSIVPRFLFLMSREFLKSKFHF